MDNMPVWTGVSTPLRSITPGAIRSMGRIWVAPRGPLPSNGWPNGLTTRPISDSPTGTEAMRPVARTSWPNIGQPIRQGDAIAHGNHRADATRLNFLFKTLYAL